MTWELHASVEVSHLSSNVVRIGMDETANIAEADNVKARRLTWGVDCGFRL